MQEDRNTRGPETRVRVGRVHMNEIYNGISARELPASLIWKKSERSNPSGNCVELANLPDGQGIAMRNSRDPQGPVLVYTKDEIDAFVRGAQDGDFNHLIA